ncbi:MAG: PHP domain-containing protein [Pleurocapsa sp. CRU_1_2]|nr:PHP domain-containing protein [Pleurocapsa sp. CRU_1_2]
MVVTYPLRPTAQDTGYLKSVWETIDAASCPRAYNFHLHTLASDGKLTPVELIEQAIAIGLKGLAITDHHSVAGFKEAESYLATISLEQKNLPQLWTGTEITSQLLEVEVHILGYGFNPEHSAISSYLQGDRPQEKAAQAERVIESIHQAGGLAVLAHPERYRCSASQLVPAAAELNIDGVETYYAYNNPQVWQPSPGKTELVQALATTHHLYSTCGTDTHGLNILQRL